MKITIEKKPKGEFTMMKHIWECGRSVPFRQPEIADDDDPRSEVNEDRKCVCGADMYFDEVPEPPTEPPKEDV